MATLAELESEFQLLAARREAAKHNFTMTDDQRIELAEKYRSLHTRLFAARKKAAAAQNPPVPMPELVAVPTLAQLESKLEEHEKIIKASKSDWSISNAKKKEMSVERTLLRCEVAAARREAAIKR